MFRIDVSGRDSEDADEFDQMEEYGGGGGNPMPLPTSAGGSATPSTAGVWYGFWNMLNDALDGLKMGLGEHNGIQDHHFLSIRHSTKSLEYGTVAKDYSLDPHDSWNIEKMEGHLGRHTNAYHDLTEYALTEIDRRAMGNTDQFLYGFSIFKQFIKDNPWTLYAQPLD